MFLKSSTFMTQRKMCRFFLFKMATDLFMAPSCKTLNPFTDGNLINRSSALDKHEQSKS